MNDGTESEDRRFVEAAEIRGTTPQPLQVVWSPAGVHAQVRFMPYLLPAARVDGEAAGGEEGELVKTMQAEVE